MTQTTATSVSPDSGTHWSEPGAWPVAPGIHRIPLPLPMDGLRAVNVYAVETGDGLTLVDGGWAVPESRTALDSALDSIGRSVGDVTRVLVTHVHRDHYTQAVAIRAEAGSHLSLGLGDKPTLDLLHDRDLDRDPYLGYLRRAGAHDLAGQWSAMMGRAAPDPTNWAYPDTWLDGDQTVQVGARRVDAVHTPGHTQGHFVFADRAAGLLFAGDHVLPTITPSIGFEPVLPDQPLGDFLGSLAKVRRLPDLRLLPAHGPVTDSSHARVDELVAHHDERLRLCFDAVAGPGTTAHDVAAAVPWTRHATPFRELDPFNGALATLETRAHLELLVARGDLAADDVDGVRIYDVHHDAPTPAS